MIIAAEEPVASGRPLKKRLNLDWNQDFDRRVGGRAERTLLRMTAPHLAGSGCMTDNTLPFALPYANAPHLPCLSKHLLSKHLLSKHLLSKHFR